jgi:hypothetical protein
MRTIEPAFRQGFSPPHRMRLNQLSSTNQRTERVRRYRNALCVRARSRVSACVTASSSRPRLVSRYTPRRRVSNPRASSRRRAAKTRPSRRCRARAVGCGCLNTNQSRRPSDMPQPIRLATMPRASLRGVQRRDRRPTPSSVLSQNDEAPPCGASKNQLRCDAMSSQCSYRSPGTCNTTRCGSCGRRTWRTRLHPRTR